MYLKLANGVTATVTNGGQEIIDTVSSNIILTKVYLITSLKLNLISCWRLDDFGVTTTISDGVCIWRDRDDRNCILGKMIKTFSNRLFLARHVAWNTRVPEALTSKVRACCTNSSQKSKLITLWHRRMGYSNRTTIEYMISSDRYGMIPKETNKKKTCDICVQTKQVREPSTGKLAENAKEIIIHMDVCGPFRTQTFDDKRYF